ncbi:MAG: hypothetical protein WC053_02690 [Sideroxydans sp.]
MEGGIERIDMPDDTLLVQGWGRRTTFRGSAKVPDHTVAVEVLTDWVKERSIQEILAAVGHRVVYGGPKYSAPQLITKGMIEDLRQLTPFNLEHHRPPAADGRQWHLPEAAAQEQVGRIQAIPQQARHGHAGDLGLEMERMKLS